MSEQEAGKQWAELSQEVAAEVADWRKAHPRATFSEIAAVVEEGLNRMRAEIMAEVRGVSEAGEGRPRCPECGGEAVWRGEKKRRLTIEGGKTIELRRRHAICPHCGAGFFPPR